VSVCAVTGWPTTEALLIVRPYRDLLHIAAQCALWPMLGLQVVAHECPGVGAEVAWNVSLVLAGGILGLMLATVISLRGEPDPHGTTKP
jgi:hypothetical protein